MKIAPRNYNKAAIQKHITAFCAWFNEASAEKGLGIQLDGSEVNKSIDAKRGREIEELNDAMQYHMVHKEQVLTAVEVIHNTIENPGMSGLVIGALQSGKTGTAFTSLFAAPIHYLKSKISYVPMFLTTNQNSHLQQTQDAMRAFFRLYGDISIISDGRKNSLIDYYGEYDVDLAEASDIEEITLEDYSYALVRDMYPGKGKDVVSALVEGMTVKRQNKDINTKIRSLCDKAKKNGHGVMLIVDEPQFGASDRFSRDGKNVKCLLSKIIDEIDDDFFSPYTPNFMVGLSATPFDSARIDSLFKVRQRLNENYIGPNFFDGQAIDPSISNKAPNVYSFSDIGHLLEQKDFTELSYLLGNRENPINSKYQSIKVAKDGNKSFRSMSENLQHGAELVRTLLDALVDEKEEAYPDDHIGALLRLSNNRYQTDVILDEMGLNSSDSPYNVIRFYDNSEDIKELVWRHTKDDPRPYIVVAVGKGRMGDAFPTGCCISMDLTHKSSDANAFLQGVFGRMCGYGKKEPVVIVSDLNKELWQEYSTTLGQMASFKSSRHAVERVVEKGKNKKVSYFMISNEMIDNEPADSPLHMLRFETVRYLESQKLSQPTSNQHVPKRYGDDLYLNLPEIMEKYNIIEYVRENAHRLAPELIGDIEIVPFNEQVEHISHKKDDNGIRHRSMLGYDLSDDKTQCRVNVSKADERAVGRSRSQNYAVPHQSIGKERGSITPVITVVKENEAGEKVESDQFGKFVFESIHFLLKRQVKHYNPGVTELSPVLGHAFTDAMSDQEKASQFGTYLHAAMLGGRKELSLLEALGTDQMQRSLGNLFDRNTHTYNVYDDVIVFENIETGAIENNVGPAIIRLNDFKNVIGETIKAEPEFEEEVLVRSYSM